PALIASKLVRYDAIDRSDVQYLYSQRGIAFEEVQEAARSLPPPFNTDALVLENLENLKKDMSLWGGERP
ncbi:MAG: hypothetical protein ABR497_09730, partial [Kiritimatiellia bacterium]